MTSNLAAGWTTSTSRMIVAASDVTNKRPRWLMRSLFLPENSICKNWAALSMKIHTIRTKAGSDEVRELVHSLNIPQNGIIDPLQMLVPILEDLDVISLGYFQRHIFPVV